MLSLFPQLLFLSPLAAFLIRLSLTGVFGYAAYSRLRNGSNLLKAFGVVDGVLTLMFLLGMSTQLAALIGAFCTLVWLIKSEWSPLPRSTTALAFVMCLSLLVMGAGPFAFDLPL